MRILADAARSVFPERSDRDGPLAPLLLALTFVTGVVDAVSYLKLHHVFVANMTGNVVFLGFAFAGGSGLSIPASLTALLAFLVGALAGGRIGNSPYRHRGHLLTIAIAIEFMLNAAALVVAALVRDDLLNGAGYALIVLLALAMGVQNAAVRKLGVADLTTTVLTLTLTGLAADSMWAGGSSPRPGRRIMAALAMLVGAVTGGLLVLKVSIAAAMGLVNGLLLLIVVVVHRLSSSSAAWLSAK